MRKRQIRSAPMMSFASVDIDELVHGVRRAWFPTVWPYFPVSFVLSDSMSCIQFRDSPNVPEGVYFNSLLNRPDIPASVFRTIAKHELAHCLFEPVKEGRRWQAHTPEFWAFVRKIAPEHDYVLDWLRTNFRHLWRDDDDGIRILRRMPWDVPRVERCRPLAPYIEPPTW